MLLSAIFLLFSLLLILAAAEGFTNGVEVFGRKYSFSQAVVGSIFAAVGTALPETILPIVAIITGSKAAGKDIGIGAILGAPFMLSTLAFFLVGSTVALTYLGKKRNFEINVETGSTKRDLTFFVVMYGSAVFLPIIFPRQVLVPLAIALVVGYAFYVRSTANSASSQLEHMEGLHLQNLLFKNKTSQDSHPNIVIILFQIILTVCVMVFGAHLFVKYVERICFALNLNPLIFSLILAPVATELPEKFNSITWTLKGKDTLAIGNITGAMVFQSTFPVSVGLLFTNWQITGLALFSAVISLIAALAVLINIHMSKKISPLTLLFSGALYLLFIITLILKEQIL